MPLINVSTFLEMDILPHQDVSINVRGKLKCHTKCVYTYTYTFQVYLRSASMRVDTKPSVFTK
jgi:hypothetical protein